MTNSIKICRLIFQMIFVTFFVGQYWYIFSQTVHEYSFGHEEHTEIGWEYQTFIQNHDNWNIKDETKLRRIIISTYYSMTTLSTIGLGDFYPVSDTERICSCFLFIIGICIFSYIMDELCLLIIKVQKLYQDIGEEDELDKFFILLRMFNDGFDI